MGNRKITVANRDELADDEMKEIVIEGDNKILLSKYNGKYFATGAKCTHYGASLTKGVCKNGHIICPLHHGVFNLMSGDSEEPPALDALAHFDVSIENNNVVVTIPDDFTGRRLHGMSRYNPAQDQRHFIIIGAGAAGESAAETLRKGGFEGKITMITKEDRVPYDRPNLSKEYLSGDAPEEWMPLRGRTFFKDYDIAIIRGKGVVRVSKNENQVILDDHSVLTFDELLIASGGEARTLNIPGSNLQNIFTLRSFDDADAIIKSAEKAKKAIVIGASFIGMETAMSLKKRGIEVTVIAPEQVPFEKVFGSEIGRWIKAAHESDGITFHLGTTAKAFYGKKAVEQVELQDGMKLDTDLAIIGIGVRPATGFLKEFELNDDGSLTVNKYLAVTDNIFAAGDIARYPDWRTGDHIRIEHWRLAQQHGRIAAYNMLGHDIPFKSVPFFWTDQGTVQMRYIGHATDWDEIHITGDINEGNFIAYYIKNNKVLAAASPHMAAELAAAQELMQIDKMPDANTVNLNTFDIIKSLKET